VFEITKHFRVIHKGIKETIDENMLKLMACNIKFNAEIINLPVLENESFLRIYKI